MRAKVGTVFPFHNVSNAYIDIMKDIWGNANCEIKEFSRISVLFKKVDFVSLNWVENQVVSNSRVKSYIKFLLMQIYIRTLSGNTNIIWTMHNKKPHESGSFDSKLAASIVNLIMQHSKFIIVHSNETIDLLLDQGESVEKKIRYLPLPNYIGTYGEILPNNTRSNTLNLLFVGSVSRYKNLEILIKAVKELNYKDLQLTIYGKAEEEYKQELFNLIGETDKITTFFRFVEDSEFPEILSKHHILVTPYDLTSSLNSATHLLAFSYCKTVLSPLNGTLKDMKEIDNSYFSYNYSDEKEHLKNLKEKISSIYTIYKEDYNQLLILGNRCHEYVLENNNKDILAKRLESYLEELT